MFAFIFSSGYLKAKQYMEEENYDKIISECSKEIDAQGKYMAEALLLRATFYLLIGSANAAKPDLDKVISLKEANVKVGPFWNVCACENPLKQGHTQSNKAMPSNPFKYYHALSIQVYVPKGPILIQITTFQSLDPIDF